MGNKSWFEYKIKIPTIRDIHKEINILEKSKGRLGIQHLSLLNKALLCKWSWWYATKRGAFWTRLISGEYGKEEGGWCFGEVRVRYGVRLWKSIRKEQNIFLGFFFFSFVAGDRRVKFWIDKRGGDEPLCVSFTSLYALAVAKEAWVADLWVQHGERGH